MCSAWLAAALGSNSAARRSKWKMRCIPRFINTCENGELHYANSTDPSIPAALSDIALGLRGLNNYRLKPHSRARGAGSAKYHGSGEHQMAPDDFATIYDVSPLYTAGIDGTGQKLVVVGQTDIKLSDIQAFPQQVQPAGHGSEADSGSGAVRSGHQPKRSAGSRPGSGMVGSGGAKCTRSFS